MPGTGFLCAIETGGETIRAAIVDSSKLESTIPQFTLKTTDDPKECFEKLIEWLKVEANKKNIQAIGVAAFGPIDLNHNSSTYGYILATPKKGWRYFDVVGSLSKAFPNIPIEFDTDVNAAALSEYRIGKHNHLTPKSTVVYITVGTGIGGGIVSNGSAVHGALHPEVGHMLCPHAAGDTYEGNCPFHKDCIEGLVASRALVERFHLESTTQLATVADSAKEWEYVAYYLAVLCCNIVLTMSPDVIVFGGGIMKRKILLPMIRERVPKILNGYISRPQFDEQFLCTSIFEDNSGIVGAAELAYQALLKKQ